MHAYDAPRPQPYPSSFQSPIPPMRPPRDRETHTSSLTPIFDALYSEYLRSFRALPGDRSGEEDHGFVAFGASGGSGGSGGGFGAAYPVPYGSGETGAYGGGYGGPGTGTSGGGWQGGGWQPTGRWSPPPVPDPWQPRQDGRPAYAGHPEQLGPVPTGYAAAGTHGDGRPHQTGTHVPAALPPAPRRSF